ncbi:RAB26 protein, partial [Prunella fulvescens]|nr:RAB26 protein [Prunella fulvescens]
QTILVGDSGVGKTSLLVQFDQGKFIPGSFSATVGIGFTVRAQSLVPGPWAVYSPLGRALFGEPESMNLW